MTVKMRVTSKKYYIALEDIKQGDFICVDEDNACGIRKIQDDDQETIEVSNEYFDSISGSF